MSKMDYRIERIDKHTDGRGDLVVFLKKRELTPKRRRFGQIYFITFTGKRVVRGNHYHKKWREYFGVVHGKVRAELEHVKTRERVSLILSAGHKTYTRLEIGPYVAHAFICLSASASLLNYADDEWSAGDRYEYELV